MFTGIVEEMGTVRDVTHDGPMLTLDIAAAVVLSDLHVGDSIAVNGVCLTATSLARDGFTTVLMPETLRRSNLGRLAPGSAVNLERALAADGRMGGHVVQGHIDGTGAVRGLVAEGDAVLTTFTTDAAVLNLVVPKGFIAVDGVSLTVVDVDATSFRIGFIPHTLAHTVAGTYRVGDVVNLETDILGKYVLRFLEARATAEVP